MKVKGNLQVSGTTEGITFSDGSTTFARQPKLTFAASDFYLSGDGSGYGKLNLKHPGMKVVGNLSFDPTRQLSFPSSAFYLTADSAGQPIVNLRNDPDLLDILQLYVEAPATGNFFVDTEAPYNYTVNSVSAMLQSGTASIGFYLLADSANNNGISMSGLDPISVTSSKQILPAVTAVAAGQQIKMSIMSVSSAKQLRISVKATRS